MREDWFLGRDDGGSHNSWKTSSIGKREREREREDLGQADCVEPVDPNWIYIRPG